MLVVRGLLQALEAIHVACRYLEISLRNNDVVRQKAAKVGDSPGVSDFAGSGLQSAIRFG